MHSQPNFHTYSLRNPSSTHNRASGHLLLAPVIEVVVAQSILRVKWYVHRHGKYSFLESQIATTLAAEVSCVS